MSDIKTIKYTDIFLGPVEMKTDTPISDSAYRNQDATMYSLCEEMKRMERILNLVSKERDDALMMLGVYRMKSDEQQQRIKRLEEALREIANEDYRGSRSTESQIAFRALEEKP